MYVFVYGTLRRNNWNHYFLQKSSFIQEDELQGYALYSLKYFPAAVYSPGSRIVGEVYEVDEPTLARLDKLEGFTGNKNTSLYVRELKTLASGLEAFVYIWPRQPDANMELIPSGDWNKMS